MSDATLASSGHIVLVDNERVYVADGFGEEDAESRVSVFDAATGELAWQRDDLTADVSVNDVFLQALVGDILVVNGQYDSVTAVKSATGETLWSFRLPEGYGAVRSAAVGDVLLVGTEAPREGDIRPPVVYALNLTDGSVLWETPLAEGTDLQWHSPPIADGLAMFSSTLSHPGSASGNMIHAVDVTTGHVRWVAELGGDQGFHFYPALISGELLVSWSPDGSAVAHRVTDGSQAWVQPNVIPMAVDVDGTVYAYASGIVELDPTDGTTTPVAGSDAVAMTVDAIVIHDDRQLVLTGRFGARGLHLPTGEQTWRIDTPAAVAPSAVTSRLIVVAIDSGVAVFDIPYTADEVTAFVESFLEKRVDGRGSEGDLSSNGLEAFDFYGAHGTTELAGRLYEQAGRRYTAGRVVNLDGIEGPDGVTVGEWEVMVELTVTGVAEPIKETLFVAPLSGAIRLSVNGGRTGWDGP
ncbi:MAG: PQQ-binding-like beta-propeller repeat protein [Acidimicrobiia bacterium]